MVITLMLKKTSYQQHLKKKYQSLILITSPHGDNTDVKEDFLPAALKKEVSVAHIDY